MRYVDISGHASAVANPGTSRDNHCECAETRSSKLAGKYSIHALAVPRRQSFQCDDLDPRDAHLEICQPQ